MKGIGVAAGLSALFLPAAPALAQCTLAMVESQAAFEHSWAVIATQFEAAQTFTLEAGEGGTLDSVTVHLSRVRDTNGTGTLEVQIQNVTAQGEPDGTVIASEGPMALGQVTEGKAGFRFASPPAVSGGTTYALVLRVDGNDLTKVLLYARWAGSLTDVYAGGAAFSREWSPLGSWQDNSAVDRHFEIHVCQ